MITKTGIFPPFHYSNYLFRFLRSLESNQIGDSGAQALANALPQCGLTYLSISSNPIGASVKSELMKMDMLDGSNPVLNREGGTIWIDVY